jgi:hypothetical protein
MRIVEVVIGLRAPTLIYTQRVSVSDLAASIAESRELMYCQTMNTENQVLCWSLLGIFYLVEAL